MATCWCPVVFSAECWPPIMYCFLPYPKLLVQCVAGDIKPPNHLTYDLCFASDGKEIAVTEY